MLGKSLWSRMQIAFDQFPLSKIFFQVWLLFNFISFL